MIEKVQIKDATLYCGDCAEVLPLISADAVVTDPPYGIGIASNPVRQAHAKKDWDEATPTEAILGGVMKLTKYHVIWGGNYFVLPPSQCFLIWDKKQPEDFSLAMCEMAWTSLRKPAKMFRLSVTSYAKEHPTQKPVPLMQWCISHLPEQCRTICDPFMGSGTTGVACAKLGRKFIGVEKDREYFDIACRRLEEAYAQPDMFVVRAPKEPPASEPDLFSAA